MGIEKKPIGDATEEELREFGMSYLGMTFAANAKRDSILSKVKQAWPKDEIMVSDGEEASVPDQTGDAPKPVNAEQQGPKEGEVRMIVFESELPGGKDPVPVSVNGKAMLIPRGQEVEVPERYFEVLANALMDYYETDEDGNLVPIPRKIPRYQFNVLARNSAAA